MLTGNHLVIALIDRRALGSTDTWLSETVPDPSSAAALDSGYAGRSEAYANSASALHSLAVICSLPNKAM